MEVPPSSADAPSPPPSSPPDVPSPDDDDVGSPPATDPAAAAALSKSQMKKRRRHEKSLAIKLRRKEQTREVKRLRAALDGRDLDAERLMQARNTADGSGRARRDALWDNILRKANIDSSFRICFDCSFEGHMTSKERNSLALQLRYAYAVNRRSSAPVRVDVCGLRVGGDTRMHLENVEGFPDRWEERAFGCHEGDLEEVYAHCRGGEGDGDGDGEDQSDAKGGDGTASSSCGEEAIDDDVATDVNGGRGAPEPRPHVGDGTAGVATARRPSTSVPLPPGHRFVYLTGDSANVLTTLDDNATYIIGGIVDRNRLKFAAVERAESINAAAPGLNVTTARLPLEEHVDLKGSTRILTCNHVFEILQRYRENGYDDWKKAIMAVLPCRKDVEEKKTDDDDGKDEGGAYEGNEDGDVDLDAKVEDGTES